MEVKKKQLVHWALLTTGILLILAQYGLYKKQQNAGHDKVSSRAEQAIKEESENFCSPRELRQKERRKLVETFCQKTGYNSMPDPSHIAVIPTLKLLYCITPKVASRQLRQMLYPFINIDKLKDKPLLDQFPKDQQKRKWETYFKFTFVREPFERILSAYKDKFVYPGFPRPMLELHGRAILRTVRPNASQGALDKLDDITFREFIEYLVTKGSDKTTPVMDWHWDNYVNICGMCAVNYDFIGHYETFDQDLADFKEAAGLSPQQAQRFDARANNKSSTASSLLSYYSKIPTEWINILGSLYRANFEMFGYNFPGPLQSLFE